MEKQSTISTCDEKSCDDIDRRPAGYSAPGLHEAGTSVDLIQGAQWRGPYDHSSSWPIWAL